jgi:hypothetical protein
MPCQESGIRWGIGRDCRAGRWGATAGTGTFGEVPLKCCECAHEQFKGQKPQKITSKLSGGINTRLIKTSEELRDVDKFYSEDLKQNQEGYYVTAIRFVSTMIRSIKAGQVEALSTNFNELSNHEKANLKRLITTA